MFLFLARKLAWRAGFGTPLLFSRPQKETMDLGFGTANQAVGDAAAKVLLQNTQAQEKAVEDELNRYDNLLQDDQAMQELRQRRLAELQQQARQQQRWKAEGHGTYTELQGEDVAKEFFEATKKSERLVVHFYRPTTRHCNVFHAHLQKLAPKHLETRFLKINVEGCEAVNQDSGTAFLVERLGIVVMPTLLIIQNRKAVHHIVGFDELGMTEDFSTAALEYVLGLHGAIHYESDQVPEELQTSPRGVNSIRLSRSGPQRSKYDEDE